MKQISIVVGLILLLCAIVFFMRDKGAREELAAAEKQITTISNEFDTIKVGMMMERSTNSQLSLQISNHMARLGTLSSRITKAMDDFKHLQEENATTKTDLEKQTKKAADGDQRIAQLESEIQALRKTIESRDADIARLRDTMKENETERTELNARLQRSEGDVVRLQLDQTDEQALRAQLNRLKRQWPPNGFAKAPEVRTEDKGAKGLTAKVDTKATGYYLEMQPDGTVKLIPPLGGSPK